jgi:hypothetical protein
MFNILPFPVYHVPRQPVLAALAQSGVNGQIEFGKMRSPISLDELSELLLLVFCQNPNPVVVLATMGHRTSGIGTDFAIQNAKPIIDRAALDFFGERDLANPLLSSTKRKALDQELRTAIAHQVNSHILPKLHDRYQSILGKHGWELAPSKDENEEMTLLFHYPNAFEYSKYLRPQIKIEFGRGLKKRQQRSWSSILNAHFGKNSPSYMLRITVPIPANSNRAWPAIGRMSQ